MTLRHQVELPDGSCATRSSRVPLSHVVAVRRVTGDGWCCGGFWPSRQIAIDEATRIVRRHLELGHRAPETEILPVALPAARIVP